MGAGGDACVFFRPNFVGGFYGNQFAINYHGKTFGVATRGKALEKAAKILAQPNR